MAPFFLIGLKMETASLESGIRMLFPVFLMVIHMGARGRSCAGLESAPRNGCNTHSDGSAQPFINYLTGKQVGPPSGTRPGGERTTPGQFTSRTFKEGESSLQYNLYVPTGYDRSKKYPLVVFVHDAGRISDDPSALAQLEGAKTWASAESQDKNPCFVLAPSMSAIRWEEKQVPLLNRI